ncbi:MAG TPA: DUF2845 domain-containing protein [Geobacteraceae bacterium]|nr:DUF2845 domain-containing protein [Geobacteraceae bacterium]
MGKRNLVTAVLLCQFLLTGTVLAGSCKDADIATGDPMSEVAGKCGQPMLKEERTVKVEETVTEKKKVHTTTTTTTIDEWVFNSGPTEQMQMLRFENGKLAEIRNIGYGLLNDPANDTCRNGELLAVGDSIVETYLKCGEPLAREKRDDKTTESESDDKKVKTIVSVVEWTYRYGPDLPGYTVRFEDGTAADIRLRKFGE